ncbi:GIY-YIG nuclease family protein [Rhodoplanes elegans]|uniref:GIY-YIG nuclease family protein n=1 Tax=Rhodoplanes elegans TaxID=29408 RepID=UPI000DABC2F3|nr:GIY-YIG nuclease family protein [Rhodoplanes elegans]
MKDQTKLETRLGHGVCGVYSIATPTGKEYIGSSVDVRRRWYEHHWRMKNGRSSSPQLSRAYGKYGLLLKFSVLEECDPGELRRREQWHIDTRKPALNASDNAYCAALWAAKKGAQLSAGAQARRCAVEDSMGRLYESITFAAKTMGCSQAMMARRIAHHDPFPCGLRFRRIGEIWKPLRPSPEVRKRDAIIKSQIERRAAGKLVHSEKAKLEKSLRTKGVPWSQERRAKFYAKSMLKQRGAA